MKPESIENCSKIFVSWSWLVGILIVLSGSLVGATVFYFGEEKIQSEKIVKIETAIEKSEYIIKSLDSIKAEIRKR